MSRIEGLGRTPATMKREMRRALRIYKLSVEERNYILRMMVNINKLLNY